MYKTIWYINDEHDEIRLTQYHFGKTPKFPSWYMEEEIVYTIEMVANYLLINNLRTFLKCLFKTYIIN